MLDQMKALVREKNMCVLATDAGGRPHCSLMAYSTDDNCEEIYMVTHRNSQKFRNMMQNAAVSLLMDSREKAPRDRAQAITVDGVFCRIENDPKRSRVKKILLDTHPSLATFIDHAEAEIFYVKINSFLLLNGISEAYFEKL